MIRQLTVDFNEELDGGLLLTNDRNATPGTNIAVGQRLVVGDDDAGVCHGEVVDYDTTTGAVTVRLLDDHLSEEQVRHAVGRRSPRDADHPGRPSQV